MYSGYAKAPVARMTSTSSMMRSAANRAATPSEYQVYGITTVASSISGGVTSNQTYPRLGAPRKAPGDPCPDVPEGACTHCVWVEDEYGNYVYEFGDLIKPLESHCCRHSLLSSHKSA